MRKSCILVIIVFTIFILTSCWNYREVDRMRFVAGVAIDYDEVEDEYIVTSEVVRLIDEGQNFGSTLFQSRGKTVFDAVRDIIMKNGRKLYWSHAKAIIISRDISNERLITVLDYTSRDAEFRDDIWILVSQEKAASEIFEETFKDRREITSFHIDNGFKNEGSISTYHGMPAWRFVEALYDKGMEPTMPIVRVGDKGGKKVPRIGGQAIFKQGKMIGSLDETEAKIYLWVINKLKGGLFTVKTEIARETAEVTMELFNNKTEITPKKEGDKIFIEIDIESDFGIGEIAGEAKVIEKQAREVLRKDIEEDIKKQVQDLVSKVQKEYESDIFDFCGKIKDKMPEEWKKIEPYWDEVFKDLKIEVKVKANIRGSALTSEQVEVVE
ncbi:MAG: Ger(x)C family spore germination protein [Clostridia bacterium]|nr:Ger(x)C family spore germination protein [Clostridia bacterium]